MRHRISLRQAHDNDELQVYQHGVHIYSFTVHNYPFISLLCLGLVASAASAPAGPTNSDASQRRADEAKSESGKKSGAVPIDPGSWVMAADWFDIALRSNVEGIVSFL